MKKTWSILCLAALLALPLAGCAGGRTGSDMGGATVSPSQTIQSPSPSAGHVGDLGLGDDDLAGSDGVVGGSGGDNRGDTAVGSGAGNTGDDYAANNGRSDDSALERVGEGVQDTLDDVGGAARRMGQDAKNALER